MDREEARDIERSLRGDGDAYARLVRRHQDAVAAYLWRFTRDRGQWEELVQDVFVEVYLSLPSYRAKAPLRHWIMRIATRVGYRFWKESARRRRQAELSLQSWDGVADNAGPEHLRQLGEWVYAVLAQCPPRDRLVLTLMYLEECSVAEIAERTGWSQTMVKVQAHRARKRLKKRLEQAEAEP